ncbi:MAG: hypothetical protein IT345_11755 [Trueperaceae bacterium]|nr:hypothetical protein [Trueperaceae bacterium]
METTHFALKGALEYTVVGARGARLYRFKKGAPLAVAIPEDVRKFRGQPDLFFECDAAGNPLDPNAVAGGAAPPPRSFKSFRPEPERPAPPAAPVPSPPAPAPALSEGAGRPAPVETAEPVTDPEPAEPEEPAPAESAEPDAARGRRARRSRGGP